MILIYLFDMVLKFISKGIEKIIALAPTANFQIWTPLANKINIPKIIILRAVPRSGWSTTNRKGRNKLKMEM